MWTLDFIHHSPRSSSSLSCFLSLYFYESGCPLPISYLGSWQSFAEPSIVPEPFPTCIYVRSDCLAYTRTVPDMYIRQVRLSCVTRQDLYHLASTLANTDGLLASDLCHLASTLTNTDDIPKVYPCHLASALTNTDDIPKVDPCHLASALNNTDDEADDFTRGRSVASNRLLTRRH